MTASAWPIVAGARWAMAATDAPDGADLVVLNTCHIREKAAEKVYSELGRLRGCRTRVARRPGDDMLIAVAGCVAQAEGEVMAERAPCRPRRRAAGLSSAARAAARARTAARGAVIDTDFPAESKFDELPASDGATPACPPS